MTSSWFSLFHVFIFIVQIWKRRKCIEQVWQSSDNRSLWSRIEKNTEWIPINHLLSHEHESEWSEWASKWVSTAERASEARRAEQANKWADERVAQYLRLGFCRGHATYKSTCRSVRPSTGPSVRPSHYTFLHFWAFSGLERLYLGMPLPKSWLPLPKSLLPLPKLLLPLPDPPR